ncbi:hypothetical protein ACQ9BO_16285 [Flavobacterium sp. P21]|uniref:hypothetical protein n=1 Tax=Flavobacterium sp. P21 TaxID=3423948 RepID=UPI003D6684DC
MKKLLIPIIAVSLLISCNKNSKTTVDKNLDRKFDKYKDNFVTDLWKIYPGWASGVGYHKLDSVLVVPDANAKRAELDFANAQLDSLKHYDIERLSDNNKTDFQMIKNQLEGAIFSINELKSAEWNPAEYNVCGAFAEILNGKYDSLDVRLQAFNIKMNNIPAYYEATEKEY